MNRPPTIDEDQLRAFAAGIFKYASDDQFVSLRIFPEGNKNETALSIQAVQINGGGLEPLISAAISQAQFAATHAKKAVFAPPLAGFNNAHKADEKSLVEGYVLSVECDQRPVDARQKLEALLGPATLVVASGGVWADPQTGDGQDKLHLHWRLTEPAVGDDLKRLKELRRAAAGIVGADSSAVPIVHPMRWPGGVHRKGDPKLVRTVTATDNEIDLGDALEKLEAVQAQEKPQADQSGQRAREDRDGDPRSTAELIANIQSGREFHPSLVPLAARLIGNGMFPGSAVNLLRAFMETIPAEKRDFRWHARHDSIPDIVASAEGKFPRTERQQRRTSDEHLARLNEKYCVIRDGGRTRVLSFEPTNLGREAVSFQSFEDFKNFYCNQTVRVGENYRPLGDWWLKNSGRRQYSGLTFLPGGAGEVNGRLNLWRGWAIKPSPGDWRLMREHIRTVLAAGDPVADLYIVNWIAWAFQNPALRAEVALVFKGKKGVGKGTLGNALCKIFGQHGVHVERSGQLVGRFNAHLRDACLLFADEAYWPGDKASEGALSALLSEPELFIEAKGRDGVSVPNMLHVMMASNEKWIVPAGEGERRYAVFEVSDIHRRDDAWFGPLHREMENGGLAAMLHDLLQHDLGDWHPRRFPQTRALVAQQARNLAPLDAWWVELLETGVLMAAEPGRPDRAVSNGWEGDETNEFGVKRRIKHRGLFDQAREISPRLRTFSDHLLGDHLREQGCDNSKKVMRRRGWTFPPLAKLRADWEAKYPGWDWRNPELTEWTGEG